LVDIHVAGIYSQPMRKIIPLLRLIRLHNCLMAGIGVWLGGYLVGLLLDDKPLYLASMAAALVCGAGNAVNDFLDVESDKINHPNRPFPLNELPVYSAILVGIIFNTTAMILALIVGWKIALIVLIAILLLLIYNFYLKRVPLLGNLTISFLGGLTFLLGGQLAGFKEMLILPGVMIPAIFAFLFHLGRELIKDMADYEGDKKTTYNTLPMIISRSQILALITTIFLILILLTAVPLIFDYYRAIFYYITFIAIDIPILATIFYLVVGKNSKKYVYAGSILKLLMFFGLIAFFLGKR